MDRLVKKSLPKQIADTIEMKIKTEEYVVGDKLPPEPRLMEIYGVSRNTVREAIQSLTNSGLLETRQGDGTYVVAKERLQVAFYGIMNSTTNQNVLEVRSLLEHHIAVSAIRNCTAEDMANIGYYLHERKMAAGSIKESTRADLNFHMAIAKATHNEIIYSVYRYVSEYFNQYISQRLTEKPHNEDYLDTLHDLLFQAIREKDEEGALDCVSKILSA